jgi:hypothetical protein
MGVVGMFERSVRIEMSDTINEIEAKIAELKAEEAVLLSQEPAPAAPVAIKPEPISVPLPIIIVPNPAPKPQPVSVATPRFYPAHQTIPSTRPLQPLAR